MIEVNLGEEELLMGAVAGAFRRVRNSERKDSWGFEGIGWDNDIEGALAEMAVAKHRKLYWSGQGGRDAPDLPDCQIRQTAHQKGHLLLHKTDKDDDRFILVVGKLGNYVLAGWIYGRDGKREEFWRTDGKITRQDCYCVPQDKLQKLREG